MKILKATLAHFVICALTTTARAQDLRPVLSVLELQNAGEEATKNCNLNEALGDFKAALRSVKQAPSGNALVSGTAGVTEGRIEERIAQVTQQQKQVAKESREVSEILKQGKAETALKRWQGFNGVACDTELGKKISDARAQAEALVAQGEVETDVRQRFQLYRSAFLLDNQLPGLYKKMSDAHVAVSNLPCNGCRAAARTTKTLIILGTIGTAAWLGFHEYEIYEHKQSSTCAPGTVCQ